MKGLSKPSISSAFWQKYRSGGLSDLASFQAALALERRARDAPDSSAERFFQMELEHVDGDPLAYLRFPSMVRSDRILTMDDVAHWGGVDRDVVRLIGRLITLMRKDGIPIFVYSVSDDGRSVRLAHLKYGHLLYLEESLHIRAMLHKLVTEEGLSGVEYSIDGTMAFRFSQAFERLPGAEPEARTPYAASKL